MSILKDTLLGTVSQEAIAYREDDSFCRKIAAVIRQYRDGYSKLKQMRETLRDLFKQEFNLTINVNVEKTDEYNFYAELPDINPNGTMEYRSLLRSMILQGKKINPDINKAGFLNAEINDDTGYVKGWYATAPCKITLTTAVLDDKKKGEYYYTDMEIAACTLHELGHIVTYFSGMTRIFQRNHVIDSHLRDFTYGGTPEQRVKIYNKMTAEKLLDKTIDEQTVSQLPQENFVTLILAETNKKFLEDPKFYFNNHTTCEVAADTFAVRMGAGSHLVTGHTKIIRGVGESAKVVGIKLLELYGIYKIFLMVQVITLVNPLSIISVILMSWFTTHQAMSDPYDIAKDRYIRIRNEIIGSLKDSGRSKEYIKKQLESIETIDICIDESRWYHGSSSMGIRAWILSNLIPYYRRGRKGRAQEQLLEGLINNDLYVASAKFKTIFD